MYAECNKSSAFASFYLSILTYRKVYCAWNVYHFSLSLLTKIVFLLLQVFSKSWLWLFWNACRSSCYCCTDAMERFPWMVQMAAMQASHFTYRYSPLWPPLAYVKKPKLLAAMESYLMDITTKICVIRITKWLEGNIRKCSGGGSLKLQKDVDDINPLDFFLCPQYSYFDAHGMRSN